VQHTYPKTPVVLTEFGWPKGPKGAVAVNIHSKQGCGEASSEHQMQVVKETFQQLAKKHGSGVVFEAFAEQWKPDNEGHAGGYWGLCDGTPPYRCPSPLKNLLQ
jgi:exo-beta-1,3-glucanase (GH17 family)